MNGRELQALVEQHIAELWQEPGDAAENTTALFESYGIKIADAIIVAANHVNQPLPGRVSPLTQATSNFISGLVLGLWLAQRIRSDGLQVEVEHWRNAAESYGRVLASLHHRDGQIRLDRDDISNRAESVSTVGDEDGGILVVVEGP